ncbi:MAG: flagellar biosynthesis protein [Candidatus Omnitrophica bacterium]|nr:flagellar biosynthesis protein [Candidatus Omnitrophota bacterium]
MSEANHVNHIRIPGVGRAKIQKSKAVQDQKGPAFKEILESKLDHQLTFSGHALQRIQRREIVLDDAKLGKLKTAVEKAEKKGARSSLVLMDDLAFIVSVKNRTVITAMNGGHIKENVFTNIDSALII